MPTSEILRYAIDLRSMTGGRGRFSAEHDHYDVLPGHLIDKAKASLAAAPAMTESPGDLAVAFRSFGRRLDEAVRPLRGQPRRRRRRGRDAARSRRRARAASWPQAASVLPTGSPRPTT